MRDTNDIKVLMCCIRKGMTVLDCRRNNMRFKLGNIQRYHSVNIDGGTTKKEIHCTVTESNWIKLDFHSIGVEKCVLQIRIITNIHNGFLSNYSILGTIKTSDKAEDISTLVSIFEKEGNANVNAVCDENIESFSAT